MFGAFNTFGKLGSPAGSRSLLAQIQSMGASFIGIPSLSNYQDRAGTTLVTQPGGGSADPPVGLALDLSQGAALGPELADSSWTGLTSRAIASTPGKTYKIEMDVVCTSGYFLFWIGDGPSAQANTSNRISARLVAGETAQQLNFYSFSFVGTVSNISVRELKGNHAIQSTSTARPKLSSRVNLLVGTATLSTQSVTVVAGSHTIFWTGAGTVTASGAYVGALTSGQTFTTTAGTLTLTVAGSVTSAQLTTGSTALRYQAVTDVSNYDYSGFPLIHQFDAVDDAHVITFGSSLGSDCTVVTANRGTTPTIATAQTIGTSHTISATHAGKLIFNRALTAGETTIVTNWATALGALA